ncbi:MAG: hypothetical protein PWQ45_115 [Thermosipho sp. (in: thermotogales)]|jgi:hypothetical protein|nr:hypothetical protein [Thermosipho sp. (in: thermotogales)]
MIYTGRFTAKYENAVKVAISVGKPKWENGYDAKVDALAPYGILNKYPLGLQKVKYKEKLEKIGAESIKDLMNKLEKKFEGKDVILCCWEDLRKPNQQCHRRWLADWLEEKTGFLIPEKDFEKTKKQTIKKVENLKLL